jgi:hypothetical protein
MSKVTKHGDGILKTNLEQLERVIRAKAIKIEY